MFDKIFPNLKSAAFWFLALAVSLAALFGYADWSPTPEQAALLQALISLISALLGLGAGVRIARR